MAVRRERQWITDVDGELIVMPGDALFLRGSPDGITRLRELAAADKWTPPVITDDPFTTDLDRAVDVLVEMKNLSEVAVGLAYSALVLGDQGLAAEVRQLEDRLDEMKDRLELWALRAASGKPDPSPLPGSAAAGAGRGGHRRSGSGDGVAHRTARGRASILGIALGDSDEVVVNLPVAAGSEADGATLGELQLNIEPGFTVLAIRRGGGYLYRPRGSVRLLPDDELIASGPDEGREYLALRCGWRLVDPDGDGEMELEPVAPLA